MTAISSYPHYTINVEDRSIFVPVAEEQLPLHRPVYAMLTQQGPIGVPVWCDSIQEARKIFGAETFNVFNEKYFSPSSYFLNQAFRTNGNFIVRLAPPCAENAMVILEVSVKSTQVQQYVKNEFGVRTVDSEGEWVPDEVLGTEDGVEINWKTRLVLECGDGSYVTDEDIENLQPRTELDNDGDTVTIYPIMVFKAVSPGEWGNDVGFKLTWNQSDNQNNAAGRAGAIFYSMAPVRKEYAASTVDPLRDIYGDTSVSFVLKPNVIDESLPQAVSFKEVVEARYQDDNTLPFEVIVYHENIELVGDAIRAVEVNRAAEITDGWMANIMTLEDLEGLPYDHVVFGDETGALTFDGDSITYLRGGADAQPDVLDSDGKVPDATVEEMVRNFYQLDVNPDIVDRARYPFTHIFDIGWSTETKYVILDFLSIRDDVKTVMSTQRVTVDDETPKVTPNTAVTDESVGAALRAAALLNRESVIKGTGCFRANIFMQCGLVNDNNYSKYLPCTLWYAVKLAEYHNRNFLSEEPAGLPNSDVDLFKELNWYPAPESQRERSWNAGLNYIQHYSMTHVHYPALRSVYRYDTSVLTIDDFTNALVYLKHEIRRSWALFAGVTRPAGILQDQITKDLSARLERMFNNRYTFNVTVYQTDEEKKLGYVHHVRVDVFSPGQNRVWNVDVVCHRENFEG